MAAGCDGGAQPPGMGGMSGGKTDPELGPQSPPEALAALAIFDDTRVHDARLQMTAEDWQSIVDDTRGDEYRHAKFYLDGVVIDDVGVRPSGESSRVPGNPKMSVRVQFDAFQDGAKLGGFDSLKLSGSWDDPFIFRDRLAYWYFAQLMPTPREVATELVVNGVSKGAYEIEQHWDRDAVRAFFSEPFGPLYRLRGMIGADPYQFMGADPAYYVPLPWDPVGSHASDDPSVIGQALGQLAQAPADFDREFDGDSVLAYFAGNALLANTDGFTGDLEIDDHYQYFDPQSGHFVMLPWDPDNTFGSINDPPDRDIFKNFGKSILTRMLRDTDARARYLAKLEEVMARIPLDALFAQTDAIYKQIHDSVARDQLKQYPTAHFEWSLGYVKDFMTTRYASVTAQIAAYRAMPPAGGSTP
ncbi:MAG TPA: CotH kinase family protein [Polyangia bacterium]|nr:CotH kinase family protein [Polyangia bacterium]